MFEERKARPISVLQRKKTALENALTRSVIAYSQLILPGSLSADPIETGLKILKQRRALGFLVQALVNTEIDVARALAQANALPVEFSEFEEHMKKVREKGQADIDEGRLPSWMALSEEKLEVGKKHISGTIKLPPFVQKGSEQTMVKLKPSPDKKKPIDNDSSLRDKAINIIFRLDGDISVNGETIRLDVEERVLLEEVLRKKGRAVSTEQLIKCIKKVKRFKKGQDPTIHEITARLKKKFGDALPIMPPGGGKKKYRMREEVLIKYEGEERETAAQKEERLRRVILRKTLGQLLTDDLSTSTETVLKGLLQGKYTTPQIAYFALLKATEFYLNIKKKNKKEGVDPEDVALSESLDVFMKAKTMDVERFKNWLKLRLGLKVKEEEHPPVSDELASMVPMIEEVIVLALAINSLTEEELGKLDMQQISDLTINDLCKQAAPLLQKILDEKGPKEHTKYVEALRITGLGKLQQIQQKAKLNEILSMHGLNELVGLFLIELEYLNSQQLNVLTEVVQTLGMRQITIDGESVVIKVDRPSVFRDLMTSFTSRGNEAQAKQRKLLKAESDLNRRIKRGIRPLIESDLERLNSPNWNRKLPTTLEEMIFMNTAELTNFSRSLGNLTETLAAEVREKKLLASPESRDGKLGYTFRDLFIMQCYVFAKNRGGLSPKEVKFLQSNDLEEIYQDTLRKFRENKEKK